VQDNGPIEIACNILHVLHLLHRLEDWMRVDRHLDEKKVA
jgi:hypothetical protein